MDGEKTLRILRHELHMGRLGEGPVLSALASLGTLITYGRWQIGPESLSHHPTLPSAIAAAEAALDDALLSIKAALSTKENERGR